MFVLLASPKKNKRFWLINRRFHYLTEASQNLYEVFIVGHKLKCWHWNCIHVHTCSSRSWNWVSNRDALRYGNLKTEKTPLWKYGCTLQWKKSHCQVPKWTRKTQQLLNISLAGSICRERKESNPCIANSDFLGHFRNISSWTIALSSLNSREGENSKNVWWIQGGSEFEIKLHQPLKKSKTSSRFRWRCTLINPPAII